MRSRNASSNKSAIQYRGHCYLSPFPLSPFCLIPSNPSDRYNHHRHQSVSNRNQGSAISFNRICRSCCFLDRGTSDKAPERISFITSCALQQHSSSFSSIPHCQQHLDVHIDSLSRGVKCEKRECRLIALRHIEVR